MIYMKYIILSCSVIHKRTKQSRETRVLGCVPILQSHQEFSWNRVNLRRVSIYINLSSAVPGNAS